VTGRITLPENVPAAIKNAHFTAMQKFSARIDGTLLKRIVASFILLTNVKQIFLGPDA
jgi:hypothetical protein